ncbi:MAG: hypothetical protein OJF47_003144 [Nitrospira sp.]|nr:MAG: hypothetical protein OJF47_003144 [Nitrospira sp.]
MRSDKKIPFKSDKKTPAKVQKKGVVGYNKKSALLEDAITQMNAGKYGRASTVLKDLLALDPLNAEARRLFATLHLRLGSLMSARAAFESLAREAMERQDYWLAESLLREYLTAGPRCVPFLEMLGHVYEDKGDVMAAVAEYGKAIEVLLEDPDSDNPNRASDLFGKIRSLAPGSPVAFRFAAMFDTVTGQMLQVTPPPSEHESSPLHSAPPADHSEAVAMPWEQVGTASPDTLADNLPEPEPATGDLSERVDAGAPLVSIQLITEEVRQEALPEPAAARPYADSFAASEQQTSSEGRFSAVATISAAADSPIPTTVEAASAAPEEADLSSPVVEVVSPTLEVLAQASADPITAPPVSPTPMPWDQIEDVVAEIPSATDSQGDATAEAVPAAHVETDRFLEPLVKESQQSIEVLTQANAHPITESPESPAPMPWDQVEEAVTGVPAIDQAKRDIDAVEVDRVDEPSATDLPIAQAPVAPPIAPISSEITSSGLTWEEILAAVTAMQASPPPTQTLSNAENGLSSEGTLPEETAAAVPSADSSETGSLSFTDPVTGAFEISVGDAPPLSAPMPWEQVEIDNVSIPRPDPEPEFGSIPSGSAGGDSGPTMVLSGLPENQEPLSGTAIPLDVIAADSPVHVDVPSTTEFRILSSDAPVEPREQPIHIPVEAITSVEESAPDASPESDRPTLSTIDLSAERPFRLALDEPMAESGREERSEPPVEVPAESAMTATIEVAPPALAQTVVQGSQDSVVESAETALAEPTVPVDQPVIQIPSHESTISITEETAVESSVFSVAPALPADQSTVSAESGEASPADAPLEGALMASRPTVSPVTQSVSSVPEAIACGVEGPQPDESVASAHVLRVEPALPFVESIQTAHVVPAAEELTVPVEPVQVVEAQAPAPIAQAIPEPAADGSLRIVWDNSQLTPAPRASIGNMLTRWLKKPAPVASAEVDYPASPLDEPAFPSASSLVDPQEATTVVVESPEDQPGKAKPVAVEASLVQPKPRKPAEGRDLHRIGQAAVSIVSAACSTTRSLVISVLALIGLMLVLMAGAVGGIALTWLVLEEQPTSAYHNMTAVPQHTLQEPGKNGYFLLLGFGAATTQDPLQAGMDGRAEAADRSFTDNCLLRVGNGSGAQQGASAEGLGKWLKGVDPAAQMRMSATGVKAWVAQAEVSMDRYRQWLTMPFEDWGYGQPVSPNCGSILHAHRLYVAEGFAQDVEAGIGRLETDLGAWRTVLGQAKTLPLKMLASDALNEDVALLGGLLLRPDLDDRLVSRLAKLARPLDQAEQSVRWPMQSRLVLAVKTLDESLKRDQADSRPLYASIAAALPLPRQRLFNAYAEYYEAAGKAAAEGRVADLPKQSQFVRTPPYGLTDLFVDPIESLVGIDPLPTWETYAGRVLETDARLRLASLQAWLRRTPPEQDLLTRIAKAGQGLYDPFTGFPMLVNMKKGALYSVGADLKDNEAQERFDLVVQIPPTSWPAGKRPADSNKAK